LFEFITHSVKILCLRPTHLGKETFLVKVPLVIDLDGTLILSDMLHESALFLLKNKPLEAVKIPLWLSQGKATLKANLADGFNFDPALLPYDDRLLNWLKEQKGQGTSLVLCTASDIKIATLISNHLGIFDEVLATSSVVNLAGDEKAKALVARFGERGFDYAGNSSADIHVWQTARKAIVVNAPLKIQRSAESIAEVSKVFPPEGKSIKTWLSTLRVHQWLKNLLLFAPLFAAHEAHVIASWFALIVAFFSFSFCASAVYIANDLFDLDSDRMHPRKRLRPFASGKVSAIIGAAIAPGLIIVSAILALYVGQKFAIWLGIYFFITSVYTWSLKRLVIVDCLTLGMLYTLRIVAGAAVIDKQLSFWLLAFSVFLFVSLAYVKRYAELNIQLLNGSTKSHGRGYLTSDAPLIQALGIASGYASVLVLALYLNSEAVLKLYPRPEIMWAVVPIILFWVNWMWFKAHRGQMHDDPLVFAVKDKASLLAGLVFAAAIAVSSLK
jgi:4-hydroxybenzoate polyprenyltransferase